MDSFTHDIRAALAAETGIPLDELRLELPRDSKLGDFAFPCFVLAKKLRNAPPKIAAELVDKVNARLDKIVAVATGPYLNFKIDRSLLAARILGRIAKEGTAYGCSTEGAGKRIVIDLSSPNIAKPMSVGHLRSTVIGAAIQRLHDALGYETIGINHIGDWGSQFGKLVAAMDRWGSTVDLESDPIKALLSLYVRFHDETEDDKDPALIEAGRAAFRELESGKEGAVRATWRQLTELSLKEFDKIYDRLNVTFDEVRGEAFYETHLSATIGRIEETGITETSDGALIVSLKQFGENVPPCLLRKTDGTTLYATRDLAAAFHRWELYQFERCLYVVGGDQRLHFQQLKHVLDRMQLDWEPRIEHIAFGMLRLPEGKMSTRKGRVVFLDDVLDRASEEALKIIVAADRIKDDEGRRNLAEQVGVGAVVFNDLKRERIKDIEFVWEEVVTFEGDTGPFVQYTHARLASILRKAADSGTGEAQPDWTGIEQSAALLIQMGRMNDVLRSAARNAEPSELTSYLLTLCREVSSWYQRKENKVLGAEPPIAAARLALVSSAKTVIANGLQILGLAAPEEM